MCAVLWSFLCLSMPGYLFVNNKVSYSPGWPWNRCVAETAFNAWSFASHTHFTNAWAPDLCSEPDFLRVIPVCNNKHGTYLSQNSLFQNQPFFLSPPALSFPSSLCPSFSFSFSPSLPLSFSVTWGLLPAYQSGLSWWLFLSVPVSFSREAMVKEQNMRWNSEESKALKKLQLNVKTLIRQSNSQLTRSPKPS